MLLPKDILKLASVRYKELVGWVDDGFKAPEQEPKIYSRQLIAITEEICTAVNYELGELKRRVVELEKELYNVN